MLPWWPGAYLKMETNVTIKRSIQLINNSSKRLSDAVDLSRDRSWWSFMRREAWLHLKLSWKLFWQVFAKKD
jgi:hypothetical protein